jgi:hypothetical protein
LLLHCNDIKGDKGGVWVLVMLGFVTSGEWHECGNQCFTKLAMSKLLLFEWLGYIWHANSPSPMENDMNVGTSVLPSLQCLSFLFLRG